LPISDQLSTQAAFGRLLNELARLNDPVVDRMVTVSPDVASSTNLGPWIAKRGVFDRRPRSNDFIDQPISSSLPWTVSSKGQHFELGITETNLFLLLAACGLAAEHHGERLFPVGTVYDPFISRGLDALSYACYQDARFILVGTPSGVTLSREGGAHQSICTPLIGIGQPGLTFFEPAYADELREILLWALDHLQAEDGGSVYLRLSTRKIEQPKREMTPELRSSILRAGYWMVPPSPHASHALVAMGAVLPEAIAAQRELAQLGPPPGLLVITSPDRLQREWYASTRDHATRSEPEAALLPLLDCLSPNTTLITVLDGHPLSLAWLGACGGFRVRPLGVSKFGVSGHLNEVYREHHIDSAAIVDAVVGDRRNKSRTQSRSATQSLTCEG
jgi:pyruvate dehydrogenase E1 component